MIAKTKNVLCCMLAVLMLMSSVPLTEGFAAETNEVADVLYSGICGDNKEKDNITWTLDVNGLLTLQGNCHMYDEDGIWPWHQYAEQILSVSIEGTIQNIGSGAFSDCVNLVSVSYIDSVRIIDSAAFQGCTALESVTKTDSSDDFWGDIDNYLMTSIGENAFNNCVNLKKIDFPDNLRCIGESAFSGCNSLTEILLPEELYVIEKKAFKGCTGLSSVVIPNSVMAVYSYAFEGCTGLTNIELSESLYAIFAGTFYGCTGLTEIKLPESISIIYELAFANCTGLKEIVIPENVHIINESPYDGTGAFLNCTGLEKVTFSGDIFDVEHSQKLSNGVTAAVFDNNKLERAFEGCINIKEINLPVSATIFNSDEKYDSWFLKNLYEDEGNWDEYGVFYVGNTLIHASTDLSGSYTVREGTATIADNAFSGCTGLEEIILPESVVTIGKDAFTDTALYNNEDNWEEGALYINSCLIGFDPSLTGSYEVKEGTVCIGSYAFNGASVNNVSMPETLLTINEYAFENSQIEELILNGNTDAIGLNAFGNCEKLTKLEINGNINNIAYEAFAYCNVLESVFISGNVDRISEGAFACCEVLKTFTVEGTVRCIGEKAFVSCTSLEEFLMAESCEKLPEGISYIGYNSFETCEALKNIVIGNYVSFIFERAFIGCLSLEKITIPDSTLRIDQTAFAGCSNLKQIDLSENIKSIGYGTFQLTSVEELLIPSTVECLDLTDVGINFMFKLKSVDVDEKNSNYSSSDGVLYNKDKTVLELFPYSAGIDEYIVPNGVQAIENFAFSNGSTQTLKSIRIPKSVKSIGLSEPYDESVLTATDTSGSGVSQLEDVYYCGTESEWNEIAISSWNCPLGLSAEITAEYDFFANATIHYEAHEWGDSTISPSATCTEDGAIVYKCKYCDAEKSEPIPATGHDWDDGVISPESTCDTHGIKTYTCQNDSSHTYTEEVPLDENNHAGETYVKDSKEPTCTENGYSGDMYCSDCDALLKEGEAIPAHGHDYKYIPEKSNAPDYGVKGYEYYECTYDVSHHYTEDTAALVKSEYTATFITTAPFFTEDKVVGTVTFLQGDKYVNEPAVTKYDNYIFSWDEYVLNDEDIVIYGRYTEIEADNISSIETEKTAELNDGVVTITLEATAETKNVQILSENTKNIDVILVLDQSGSMAQKLSGSSLTKRDALVNCANEFAEKIYNNALETGADHRVAVVGFSYSEYNNGAYKNTGMLASAKGSIINYKELTASDYQSALLPIVSGDGINSLITEGINSVVAEGATAAHLGLEMANNIFAVTPKEDDRDRIVIFITDGTPTSWNETASLVDEVAAKAITEADELKNAHGAAVYSIGVHANCDTAAEFTAADNGITTDNRGNFQSYDFNRFLHAVSSNYPEAKSMYVSELGEGSKQSGYYLGVTDTDKLSSIFSKILFSKVYEIVSFDKVTLFDTLTKEFTLTLEQEAQMREYLINEKGVNDEDITVIRNADGTTYIRIENVRTEKVYNEDSSSFYRASASFNASADEDSLSISGNVPTNTEDAGVEYNGSRVEVFKIPEVILEQNRKLVVFTVNGVVYRIDEALLGETVTAPENAPVVWVIPEGTVVENEYTVFEASTTDATEYTVTWISENSESTEKYKYADIINVPVAGLKDGYDFLRWSPAVPSVMPMHDITFTAIYTPSHVHEYTADGTYGECQDGITTVYTCSCGDSYEEQSAAEAHNYRAVVENTYSGTLIDMIVCDKCGKENTQNLIYKVSYKDNIRSYVLDLTLYENEVLVQPDGTLQIRFYLGSKISKNYTVYRIDENGNMTTYTPEKENGYLIFDADHFSIYIVAEIDTLTDEAYYLIAYEEALCVLNGHSYNENTVAPTCIEDGYTEFICTTCGDSYRTDETEMLGHSFKEYSVIREATCTETGMKQAVCIRCTETDDISIPLTEHTYDSEGYCSECGKEISRCPHLCHKDNIFAKIVWCVIRFICSIFGTAHTCSCGESHY